MRFAIPTSPPPIIPPAAAIRERMKRGEDTKAIADSLFVPEAEVWNTIALGINVPLLSAGFSPRPVSTPHHPKAEASCV